ncbi:hypothetical protein J2Q11_08610 [Tenacibaculum finnmarkense genomovar finnmarkense]|uniref:hypothetical protein n=1 Tax=Tenacibaculum finnmarkense TaxID=2781243 RepID=UPI001EFAD123|nr:hypothetical protein [Tenacibaculum finnmarkense]MCG8212942.1 hypothetical protein [Tenacibaculum finnmarkense genomovar finnmarkense]MCG8231187.1 hypothetical protein [Tenacibaculum finnmarkense genomovar finnmarkense]MCG8884598.1 hypothetical protein [Tenacibaculum finnmarkense]MCG8897178.1 hypothetical protein [Tenacibaculum finnmarkense]MCG8903215.1 hypothetical protein [Tenacibaculum finnmarkense]
MIYELKFKDKTEFLQAENQLKLLQCYEEDYFGIQDILQVREIKDDEAKLIMLSNIDDDKDVPDEISLFDLAYDDDFALLGSTDLD